MLPAMPTRGVLMFRDYSHLKKVFYDRIVMRDLNKLGRSLELKRLYGYEHGAGDLAFLADVPEFTRQATFLPMYVSWGR